MNLELPFPRIMDFKSFEEMYNFQALIRDTFSKIISYEYLGFYPYTKRFIFMVFPAPLTYKELSEEDKATACRYSWYGDQLSKLYEGNL